MAITLGDAFQNWNPDTKLATGGAKVDGGVIAMLEPNIFRNKVMLPGVTFATDVESLMVDNRFAVALWSNTRLQLVRSGSVVCKPRQCKKPYSSKRICGRFYCR